MVNIPAYSLRLTYQQCTEGKERKGNALFNDRLNTFYLLLYGIRHMIKDHSDSERKPAATTWATLYKYQQGFFYMHHPTDRIAHTTTFVTPVVEHWLEWEIAPWIHDKGLIWRPIAPWANTLTTELHLAPLINSL